MIPPINSLVRYDEPLLVSSISIGKGGKGASVHFEDRKSTSATEDILHSILPPREWTEEGELWVQYVSSHKTGRVDVIQLLNELDRRLQQRQARESGICPVREELFSRTFDELIRQVTIECPEQGLLLLRLRDEIRMTTAAYQVLYESSLAFAVRTGMQGDLVKSDLAAQIKTLEQEKRDRERQLHELNGKLEAISLREQERWKQMETKHKESTKALREQSKELKAKVTEALQPPKWN